MNSEFLEVVGIAVISVVGFMFVTGTLLLATNYFIYSWKSADMTVRCYAEAQVCKLDDGFIKPRNITFYWY